MTRKPRWQEQVEQKLEAALSAAPESVDVVAENREPDYLWMGKPVYRCRRCTRYERVGNLAAVLEHETSHAPEARESAIVGPNGESLVIVEGD